MNDIAPTLQHQHQFTPISENSAAPYSYLISLPRLKLVYVELAKCGCTGLKKLCLTLNRDIPYGLSFNLGFATWRWLFPECVVRDINEIPDDMTIFTVVRNPFKRLVSAYRSRWLIKHPEDTFEQFIECLGDGSVFAQPVSDYWNNHFRPVSHFIPTSRQCKIFRLEDDHKELLSMIFAHSGRVPLRSLPVVHTTDPTKFSPVTWTPPLIEIVQKQFADDFRIGRYDNTPS